MLYAVKLKQKLYARVEAVNAKEAVDQAYQHAKKTGEKFLKKDFSATLATKAESIKPKPPK